MSTPDAVALALEAVDEESFTHDPDGTMIAQSSSPAIIATMLRELDVAPGDTVLEIGTGSSFSTALLAHLTGPDGTVATLDVVPALTARAARLLPAAGYRNVYTITVDGALGEPDYGPYDKIIAWTTPETVPATWIAQAADGARLVTPVNVTGLSKTYAVINTQILAAQLIPQPRLIRGAFVEMSGEIRTDWLTPPHGIDALHTDGAGNPWWLSADWIGDATFNEPGTDLARTLATGTERLASPLREDEDALGFYAWLLATRPEGLTTACLGDPQWWIGHCQPGSAAFIPLAGRTPLTVTGQPDSAKTLTGWVEQWRREGSIDWHTLRPQASPTPHGDWVVRVGLAARD